MPDARYIEARVCQLNVLLVDDNAFMRRIVRSLLGTIGVKNIAQAADGIEALEAIRNAPPDVVLLDWEMPLLSGPEVVRIVRSSGIFPTPDIPIVMLTAHSEAWRIDEAIKLGVNQFLRKPVSATALRDHLTSIVVRSRTSVALGKYVGPVRRPPWPGAPSSGRPTA